MNTIKFTVRKVIDYLIEHGEVYTIRKTRPVGYADIYFYDELVAMGLVGYVRDVHSPDDLKKYVEKSGFDNEVEWFSEAVKLHKTINVLKLYHVIILEWIDRKAKR